MALRSGERAPYAPPAAVLAVVRAFRDRGLTTPFTQEVLLRAGISESLVPRTLKSLEDLELIDQVGNPTDALESLRRATSDDFKPRLAEVVRKVYAEVFQFTDPSTDDTARVTDAFRAYEPVGQRDRMVTLFLGLCVAAGIVAESAVKRASASNGQARPSKKPVVRLVAKPLPPEPHDNFTPKMKSGSAPQAVLGILSKLPPEGSGWTQAERDKFVEVLGTVLDFVFPIVASAARAE
jgi:hypothetical protein